MSTFYASYPVEGSGGGGSGTVTSVGLALPSIFTVSGSPVTTAGTLTGTLNTQSANLVFAGPTSGGAAIPTFRSLMAGDLPITVSGTTNTIAKFISSSAVGNSGVTDDGTTVATSEIVSITPNSSSAALTVTQSGSGFGAVISGGFVGIGTTTPAQVLDVVESISGSVGIQITNTNSSNQATAAFSNVNNLGYKGQLFKTGSTYVGYKNIGVNDLGFYNDTHGGNISVLNDYASGNISFIAGGASSPYLYIGSNGSIGIGTTIPIYLLDVIGDIASDNVGSGFRVKEGSNAKMGVSTLVGGTVVVSNTSVTANSRIFLTAQNNSGTPGFLSISARTAGTSFTILSSSALDTSTVAWILFEPS